MGSRSISPRAPTQQIVYVPQSTSVAETSTESTSSSTSSGDTGESSTVLTDEQKSEVRTQNLLSRDRSRLGTVLSGFRGILGLSNQAPSRKSLLGE